MPLKNNPKGPLSLKQIIEKVELAYQGDFYYMEERGELPTRESKKQHISEMHKVVEAIKALDRGTVPLTVKQEPLPTAIDTVGVNDKCSSCGTRSLVQVHIEPSRFEKNFPANETGVFEVKVNEINIIYTDFQMCLFCGVATQRK